MNIRIPVTFGLGRKLPVILQTEAAECGLACIAMIASWHGHETDIASIRRQFSVSAKGLTIGRLIEIAHGIGFQSRPLRIDIDEIGQLRTPCILHWNMNHFVVLKRWTKNGVCILDPAIGEYTVQNSELSRSFTGVALELFPGHDFHAEKNVQPMPWKSLFQGIDGLSNSLGKVLLLALVIEVFAIVSPLFIQFIVDHVLTENDGELLGLIGVGFFILCLCEMLVLALRAWGLTNIGTRLNVIWTGRVFSHLLKLPEDYFQKRNLGDIASRFDSISAIQQTVTTSFIEAILDGLMAIFTLGLIFAYGPLLACITVGALLIYITLRFVLYSKTRSNAAALIIAGSRQQSRFLEAVRGVQAIRLFNRTAQATAAYMNSSTETANRILASQRFSLSFASANRFIFGSERILIVCFGAQLVLSGHFSVGMLLAFAAYSAQFSQRAVNLVDYVAQFKMLELQCQRLGDIVLTEQESHLQTRYAGEITESSLSIKQLGFRYSKSDPWVIRNCTFDIPSGQSVAFVGSSGCGKTTLAKLLLGLLDQEDGVIEIGGIDIRRLGKAAYRTIISSVMQDDQLFSGSISDNISFFDPGAKQNLIEAAARLAHIHDDIAKTPMGYNTLVGEMGSVLSGGQKQRILLARALYRRPRILLMDEATSHLDIVTERAICDAIRRLRITRIIVAHRPDTIESADRILRIENGHAYEQEKQSLRKSREFVSLIKEVQAE